MLIFSVTKDIRVLFLIEYYTIKVDIICYLLRNSTVCGEKILY